MLATEPGDVAVRPAHEVGATAGGLVVGSKVEPIVGPIEGEAQIGAVLAIRVGIVGAHASSKLAVPGPEVDDRCLEVAILGDLLGDVPALVGRQVDGTKALRRGRKIAEPGESLQCPVGCEKVVDHMKSAIRVSEHGHGEVSIGHHDEPRALPLPGAAVLNDGHILRGGPQHPGHAHPGQFHPKCSARPRVRAHCLQRLSAQNLLTVRRPAVAEVELCVTQLISRCGHQPTGGVAAARECPKVSNGNRFAVDHAMRCGHIQTDYLVGKVARVSKLQRVKQQPLNRRFVGCSGDKLDDAARNHKT